MSTDYTWRKIMNYMTNNTYLAHHGIQGQKWGVRRYQNPDGTLTEAGKKRYKKLFSDSDPQDMVDLSVMSGKSLNKIIDYKKKTDKTSYKIAGGAAGVQALGAGLLTTAAGVSGSIGGAVLGGLLAAPMILTAKWASNKIRDLNNLNNDQVKKILEEKSGLTIKELYKNTLSFKNREPDDYSLIKDLNKSKYPELFNKKLNNHQLDELSDRYRDVDSAVSSREKYRNVSFYTPYSMELIRKAEADKKKKIQ